MRGLNRTVLDDIFYCVFIPLQNDMTSKFKEFKNLDCYQCSQCFNIVTKNKKKHQYILNNVLTSKQNIYYFTYSLIIYYLYYIL